MDVICAVDVIRAVEDISIIIGGIKVSSRPSSAAANTKCSRQNIYLCRGDQSSNISNMSSAAQGVQPCPRMPLEIY